MTARQVFEAMLTELSKVNAPSMLLHEFNYYFNKAINQYINKRYNIYDVNQQTTDDLRVLKATTILDPIKTSAYGKDLQEYGAGLAKLFDGTWEVNLPDDYLHMLNCICVYELSQNNRCYNKGDFVQFSAKRLTSDSWSTIINDFYNRPLPERPYYYIHNVNTQATIPTNPLTEDNKFGTDLANEYNVTPHILYVLEYRIKKETEGGGVAWVRKYAEFSDKKTETQVETEAKAAVLSVDPEYEIVKTQVETEAKAAVLSVDPEYEIVKTQVETEALYAARTDVNSNFPRTIKLGSPDGRTVSTVEKDTGTRYGNASKVRCEIRYGNDSSVFGLKKVIIDYIKAPQTIRLTKELVDLTEDTSQIMEFPDYVCQEIINELVILVMLRDSDPRIQSLSTVTQSIATPAQQLAPQPHRG